MKHSFLSFKLIASYEDQNTVDVVNLFKNAAFKSFLFQ